jgi:P-type Mg2+ transporter
LNQDVKEFWSLSPQDALARLGTAPQGLSTASARERLQTYGPNLLKPQKQATTLGLFLAQFKTPIILILIFAAILSYFLGDAPTAIIILVIVFISGVLGFWQERGAADAIQKLLAVVEIKASVVRDGTDQEIPIAEVVPGDLVVLRAGDIVPGDCRLVEIKDLFLDEAALTGETFPVEKSQATLSPETPLAQRVNCVFMGTHVVNGSGQALVVKTGRATEFGMVADCLALRPPETEFERGVRRFGFLLMEVTLTILILIFASNIFLKRPVMDSFLFALALAVGLTPQLLPAIISVNLARGAKRMAEAKVIVRRLAAIENFGSMNVLCSDKTGTITEGAIHLKGLVDVQGQTSEKVQLYAYLNASFEAGFVNPIDLAIRNQITQDIGGYEKLDEIPYDFIRKRLSVLVRHGDQHILITKGAVPQMLEICSQVETGNGQTTPLEAMQGPIHSLYEDSSNQGYRTLAIAYRSLGEETRLLRDHESQMVLLGFVVLYDPPKAGVAQTLDNLKRLGVSLKIITGDNRLVADTVARQVGMVAPRILTGPDMRQMADEALRRRAPETDIFAEVEPIQKERIILALKKAGNVVGYMGDGINDASALHAADVGISVQEAVDVAKEAADIVLLEHDLAVLERGVREGRTTFANTLKYVFMAVSANFGNMFSMAGASLILPFLPLLPTQILLTNLLTDFPEMTIATDRVDPDMVEQPRRWDIGFIRNFMVVFGVLSSVFDYMTFGVLLLLLKASPELFRTGWFQESVVSACLIVLVIRTRRPFIHSKPGKYLLWTNILVIAFTLVLPWLPGASYFELRPLPSSFYLAMAGIVGLYILSAEVAKRIFYRVVNHDTPVAPQRQCEFVPEGTPISRG